MIFKRGKSYLSVLAQEKNMQSKYRPPYRKEFIDFLRKSKIFSDKFDEWRKLSPKNGSTNFDFDAYLLENAPLNKTFTDYLYGKNFWVFVSYHPEKRYIFNIDIAHETSPKFQARLGPDFKRGQLAFDAWEELQREGRQPEIKIIAKNLCYFDAVKTRIRFKKNDDNLETKFIGKKFKQQVQVLK